MTAAPSLDTAITNAVAVARMGELTTTESATAAGVVHALRNAGLSVADDAAAGRAAVRLVFAPLTAPPAALADGRSGPCIVHPMLRDPGDVAAWMASRERVHSFWTSSRTLAERLAAGGATAHWIGSSCQLGAMRHFGRRSRGLREEDRVFVAFVDARTPAAAAATLQRAWDRRRDDPATRYEKATLLIAVIGDATLRAWQRWAERPEAGAVVVQEVSADPPALAGLIELADCEILFGASTFGGLAPSWTAGRTLVRGKPVIALGDVGAEPFGTTPPPHLVRIDATDADALAAAMQPPRAGDTALAARCAEGARHMLASCSARAVAVRAIDALRATGLWHDIERTDS